MVPLGIAVYLLSSLKLLLCLGIWKILETQRKEHRTRSESMRLEFVGESGYKQMGKKNVVRHTFNDKRK